MELNKKNLVSVVITTFARPDNLKRAIKSVQAQTYSPIEIIVVDDNGLATPDQIETEKILSDFINRGDIQYITHDVNKNGSAARNTGFKVSKGEYINFLDDDDEFVPTKIEEQVKKLIAAKEYDACYCNTRIHGRRRDIVWKSNLEGNLALQILKREIHFNTSSVLFRRQSLKDIGGWDERFLRHQDLELEIRFFRKHKICVACPNDFLLDKYNTPNVVSKNPQRSIEYRDFFLKEMMGDIEATGHKKEILKCQYEDLSVGLLAAGCKNLGIKNFIKIFRFGFPKGISWVKLFYYLIIK